MFNCTTLTNCFGQSFLFTQKRSSYINALSAIDFVDEFSAERFLSSFREEEVNWRKLVLEVGEHIAFERHKSGRSYSVLLASVLARGKLNAYKLPAAYTTSFRRPSVAVSQAGSSDYLEIAYAAATLDTQARPEQVSSHADAAKLVASLKLDQSKLRDLAKQLMETNGGDSKRLTEALTSRVAKGELVVLNHGPRRAPSAAPEILERAEMPFSRPVPLAPEPENWIEAKLLDEDGQPVVGQNYIIKDANGTEYTGETDANGAAWINRIAAGNCEIDFVGLEGWS